MAISMSALLKIKADVQGEGAIQGLASKLGGLQKSATNAQGGLRTLAGSTGGLVSGLQNLIPLASGAGLVALGTNAINAADDMNDLSQKTGVSVEVLSQFKQAAEKSGTSIEGVAGAMLKLNKGLVSGQATDALKSLGISATDASGKLKPTQQIMLEVAGAFAKMPDGAEKSAIAMQLFGKSGADMIPMLNMGDKAIKALGVTMTTEFAQKADEFNDTMVDFQTSIGKLAVSLGTALLPVMSTATDALIGFVNAFQQLPGPLQSLIGGAAAIVIAWGPLVGIFSTIGSIIATLGPLFTGLAAIIAGWAGAIGPAIAVITTAFSGLLTWLGTVFLPAALGFFSGPVGWTVLAVAAVVAMCIAFREPIINFFNWLGGAIANGLKALWQWGEPIRKFWIDLWNGIVQLTGQLLENVRQAIQNGFGAVSGYFNTYVAKPIQSAWQSVTQFFSKSMSNVSSGVSNIWKTMMGNIKNVINGILRVIGNSINAIGREINKLIDAYNRIPVAPDIPRVPIIYVPQFAQGGYVNRSTLAMVGEGGEAEYIIPESKMARASALYSAGRRGADVLSAASPLVNSSGSVGQAGTGLIQIDIRTGPVVELEGKQYVTITDLERAMRITAEGVIGRLRTPSARTAIGMR